MVKGELQKGRIEWAFTENYASIIEIQGNVEVQVIFVYRCTTFRPLFGIHIFSDN